MEEDVEEDMIWEGVPGRHRSARSWNNVSDIDRLRTPTFAR
jgi:hypothetical protein